MRRRRFHMHFFRGSHMPVLIKLVQMTTGPILELGSGFFSTSFLHWACFPTKRRLVSYENVPDYFPYLEASKDDFHEVHCLPDWSGVDWSAPWTIAFVDNDPEPERRLLIPKLAHAEYVVVHDVERRRNGFDLVFAQFKYHFRWRGALPHTSVLSNTHDLRGFTIP